MVIDSETHIEAGQNGQALNEKATRREFLRTRFKTASVFEMDHLFFEILDQIQAENQNLSTFDLYKKIAEATPKRILDETQQAALQAAVSSDLNVSKLGKKIFLYLNLKSVFSAIDEFVEGGSADEADEIVQAGIIGVLEKLDNLSPQIPVAQQVYIAARRGAAAEVAAMRGVTVGMVLNRTPEADEKIIPEGWNEDAVNRFRYLLGEDIITAHFLIEDIRRAISTLSPRERKVIGLRYGLDDTSGKPLTLDETGKVFSVTSERIRQMEARALRKLRHPTRSRKLKDYLESEVPRRSILDDGRLVPYRVVVDPAAKPEVPTAEEEKETWLRKMRYLVGHIKVDGQWLKWVSEHPLPEGATIDDDLKRYREYMKAQGENIEEL